MHFTGNNVIALYAVVGAFLFGALAFNSERIAEAIMRLWG